MKAAVIFGKKDVRVQEWEEPQVTNGTVKVKVEWAGICGSDLHAYHHGIGFSVEPHPVSKRQVPLVLGHEFSGTIVEVGDDVTSVKVGDRVAIEPLIYLDNDYYVRHGKYNIANDFGFLGLNADGGFGEYCVVADHKVHKLPDNVSFEEGALVEPTAVAFQAVKESGLKVGDMVAVFGAGPIGLLTVMAAKAAGASKVYAIDLSEERLQLAEECGADVVINSGKADAQAQILADTGIGVDVCYEAAGVQATFTQAMNVLKKGGELMVIAAFTKPVEVNMSINLIKEAKVTASLAYRHVFPDVVRMISSGQLDVKKVITRKITLDDIVQEGLELLQVDKSQAKILIKIV